MAKIYSASIDPGADLRPREIYYLTPDQVSTEGRRASTEQELRRVDPTQRRLPCTLMYDAAGLDLWSKIIDLPDYYITKEEIGALQMWAKGIVQNLGAGNALIDLGSGDVRKVLGLLHEFENAGVSVYYFALDMSAEKLQETMQLIPQSWRHVTPFAICGTFAEGREWSQRLTKPKCFLFLGGTIGNDEPEDMINELSQWSSTLKPEDRMLIGLDSNQNEEMVLAAYNDTSRVWHDFIENGFLHSNRVLGASWFKPEDWCITGVIQHRPFRHQFVAQCRQPVHCQNLGLDFRPGDRITTYPSYKYTVRENTNHFTAAGLEVQAMWKAPKHPVYQYFVAGRTNDDSDQDSAISMEQRC